MSRDKSWKNYFKIGFSFRENRLLKALYTNFLKAVPGEKLGWKTVMPGLQVFVLDVRMSGCSSGLSEDYIKAFVQMRKCMAYNMKYMSSIVRSREKAVGQDLLGVKTM
ncbi:hypothetical protein HBH98_087140 [Parastagonospora nodorum]|nr:hypothetical protein HBH53_066640 [Parastagonospora nodorum]KAH3999420.1 hypothetical protein HBI10_113920 [Parastagonospora nodorum]KAH4014751.1 hypothetical protein HBI13_170240 [Parastagonospora nodorum]KAH4035178.1 hypothetical protein HBI09_096370 [Parastagonospora nodorum]KAH4066102.1 hypothetical protein HBH50_155380 [Parastagonospora nodorum]